MMTQEKTTIEGNRLIEEFFTGNKFHYKRQYYYHRLWDKLMPVVEKIRNELEVADTERHELLITRLSVFPKIGEVYKAVLQYIKWYNNQNKKP